MIKYYSCTIHSSTGVTYWQQPQDNLKKVYRHINAKCRRPCHVIIYKGEENKPLIFVKHISNFIEEAV